MIDRRRIEVRPSGALWNPDTFGRYLADLDARAKRPTVARLSASDPEIAAFEATSRGVRTA